MDTIGNTGDLVDDVWARVEPPNIENLLVSSSTKEIALLERFPLNERHYKSYRYFINRIHNDQKPPCQNVDRSSVEDLIPHFLIEDDMNLLSWNESETEREPVEKYEEIFGDRCFSSSETRSVTQWQIDNSTIMSRKYLDCLIL